MSWRGTGRGHGRGSGGGIPARGGYGPAIFSKRPKLDGPRTSANLASLLVALDGGPYPAYKDLRGAWSFPKFALHIDHIQADPYAPPSKFRVELPHASHGFPVELFKSKIRSIALADYLHRRLHEVCSARGLDVKAASSGWSGGKGGDISIDLPASQVLERTAVVVGRESIEARITIGLPAAGRSIQGRRAAEIICEHLPNLVSESLVASAHRPTWTRLVAHVDSIEDQEALRDQLSRHQTPLVAFIRNGAILPRQSGASTTPLSGPSVVPFTSPANLLIEIKLPNSTVSGMGLPAKSLIVCVGAGYHGKSTLLEAISLGCYNYLPGDGREFVSSVSSVTCASSEDGRSVSSVDLSNFILNLPGGKSTDNFSTTDASGSTSCAAGFMEALELGSQLICIDEDTTASNWLSCSPTMRKLIKRETIVPLESRASQAVQASGASLFLVCGSSSDFLRHADLVLRMEDFLIEDVTEKARILVSQQDEERGASKASNTENMRPPFRQPAPRILDTSRLLPDGKVFTRGRSIIRLGGEKTDEGSQLDLRCIPQVVYESQTRSIIAALRHLQGDTSKNSGKSLKAVMEELERNIASEGLDCLQTRDEPDGSLARIRWIDLAGAINRMRGVEVKQQFERK
ncbi:hypothetical protein BCV69DRAFT_281150 [Microstroma glucosiphilum]|uniref:Uncharacterized protein n=1 Tax=Pseudomicrostroma glucosiphilum TaxID=1684307 RepID=A0A316UG69_9BASI|nr:hypothetical protein BCV69DRAFT_281150 [Pseudomicrostroma glucosiphilum]PWN22145.1 hypothetical protein BCV69DRAFT_281150 [Pseudomicrostroma glucosiphilum]